METKQAKPLLTRDQKMMMQQDELAENKAQQLAELSGTVPIEMVPGNVNSNFKIKAREAQGYVHLYTVIKHLTPDQKSFNLEKKLIPIRVREFERMVTENAFSQYDEIEIVHYPGGLTKEYNFKKEGTEATSQLTVKNDNIAAREKVLSEREARVNEAIDQINDKFKELNVLSDNIKNQQEDLKKQQDDTAAKSKELDALIAKAKEQPISAPVSPAASAETKTPGPQPAGPEVSEKKK